MYKFAEDVLRQILTEQEEPSQREQAVLLEEQPSLLRQVHAEAPELSLLEQQIINDRNQARKESGMNLLRRKLRNREYQERIKA